MFAITIDSQVCQKERRMTNKKNTITATYYTEEGFLFRYLPQPAAVPQSPNSGLAVMTVVS